MLRRWPQARSPLLALAIGVLFVAVLLAAHWPFGQFLMSKASHNWFFAGDNYTYGTPKTSFSYRGLFPELHRSAGEFWRGIAWAGGFAALSAWLGLAWGGWMRKVRR